MSDAPALPWPLQDLLPAAVPARMASDIALAGRAPG
jgi:hypothetical protein